MIKQISKNNLEYLISENIAIPHAFTTRTGGVSTGIFAGLNLGMHRGDSDENVAKNRALLAQAIGYDPEKMVMSHQTHSDIVRRVTSADAKGIDHKAYPECDGLITNEPGVALWIFTADCTPSLLHDPVTGAVGAVHAGWRGTASKIAAKAVAAMVEAFGCEAANIRAAIGPNIGQCCFQTDADVPEAMINAFGDDAKEHIRKENSKYYVNLKALNALALRQAGVTQIEISGECTACNPDKYWSHRATGGNRGSQGAIILCKEVAK